MKLTPLHPGEVLREEFLEPLGLTVDGLALYCCVSPALLQQILTGRISISGDTALCLSAHLGTTADFWINLQSRYDAEHAELP